MMRRQKQPAGKKLVTDARAVAQTCIGLSIRGAERRITRFLEARMAGADLSLAQFGLVVQIAAADDDTIGSLAERVGLDQSTLSRNLRGLEKAGLVEIAAVENDLRRRAVWLTEAGARRLESAIPLWQRAHAALAKAVSPGTAGRLAVAARTLV